MLRNIKDKGDKYCIPVSDNLIIERASDTKDNVNGLYIDTSYDRISHVIQHGIVRYVPKRLSSWMESDVEVKEGDKVYCHHFIGEESNCIEIHGEQLNMMKYNMYYARVRDGKIHMLMNWILVDYLEEKEVNYKTDSGIWLKANAERFEQVGIVRHINSKSKDFDINIGDKVLFIKDADYEMEIEGKKMYRMKNEDVLCKIEGDVIPEIIETEIEDEQVDMDKVYDNLGKLH